MLDIDGILLYSTEVEHGELIPYWAKYMCIVKESDNVYHVVHPDATEFLEFCFQWVEIWIWTH